jgi:pectinesterase
VADGTYKEKVVIAESKSHIQLIARTEGAAVITYDDYAQKLTTLGEEKGTSGSATVYVYAPDFEADGITFSNTAGPVGQAVAILVKGDRAVFRKCRFLGHQDTLYAYGQQYKSQSRQYYEDCYIEGTVDYIFGWATAVFNRCELHSVANGYVTAAATPEGQQYGYVFLDCHLTAAEGAKAYLGRPWRAYAQVVYIRCEMDDFIHAEGWKHWNDKNDGATTYYAEYKSIGAGAQSAKRAAWSHQLTAKEAKAYTVENILKGDDEWTPTVTKK